MKAVKVEWLDSASNSHWFPADDCELTPTNIVSFGFVLKDEKDYIVLAQNYCEEIDEGCNRIAIPKGCITKLTDLL